MPFVPVADTALVECRMLYDGQRVENTLWFQNEGGPFDPGPLGDLAAIVHTWWQDHYSTLVSDLVTLSEVVATDMASETGAQVSVSASGDIGQQIGGGMPGNVSLAVSFRTTARGRSFRGRNYLVGVPTEQMVTISSVESAYAADVATEYTALIAAAVAGSFDWVVASRFSGVDGDGKPIPRTAGVVTPISNVIVVDRVLDSQRRRLPGRGQ